MTVRRNAIVLILIIAITIVFLVCTKTTDINLKVLSVSHSPGWTNATVTLENTSPGGIIFWIANSGTLGTNRLPHGAMTVLRDYGTPMTLRKGQALAIPLVRTNTEHLWKVLIIAARPPGLLRQNFDRARDKFQDFGITALDGIWPIDQEMKVIEVFALSVGGTN